MQWGYDPDGKRVSRYQVVGGNPEWTFYYYNIQGQQIGQVTCKTRTDGFKCLTDSGGVYFGDKLIARVDAGGSLTGVVTDRLGKTVTKGTAPALSIVYDPATNRPVGSNYDANGNAPIGAWDIENRLVSQTLDGQAITWGYDASNQRFLKYAVVNGQPTWVFYLRNIAGQQVAELTCNSGGASCTFTRVNTYFGDKLIASTDASGRVLGATDRLGSVRAAKNGGTWTQMSYYPYGEPKTPGGVDGAQQFATYTRDSTASAQDYADQRYYSNVMGRFYSPDAAPSVHLSDPVTWNRYAYVGGDPINRTDPHGTEWVCTGPSDDRTCNLYPDSDPANVFPVGAGGAGGHFHYAPFLDVGLPRTGGGGPDPLGVARVALSAIKGKLSDAAASQKTFTAEQLDCISGIETGRTWDPNIVAGNGRVGLFQFNQNSWAYSGTTIACTVCPSSVWVTRRFSASQVPMGALPLAS